MTTHLPHPSPPQPEPTAPVIAPPPPLPGTAAPGGDGEPEAPPAGLYGPGGARGPGGLRGPGGVRGLPARLWRGRAEDPRWARPALLGLLAATAVLYLWDLSVSGWANAFYSAAVQAGTVSWKAFFFGSSDASGFITVDKPPMSLWPMELSARLLGLSSFSVLLPQALMGVAAVGTVHASVRRRFSPQAGLLAGAVLALTPVAALMFRFNNPDALLVLLLALAAYAVQRAQEAAGTRWLVLAGTLFGFAFLTKTLQAFLVLPAFALVYLVTAPTGPWRRVRQLLLAGLATVVAGGWWVAIVELVPASSRPYVGGSQDDSFLSLTFGYNGFGRLTGDETGSVGGGGGGNGGGRWGATGITRLLDGDIGGQIAWLVPAALLLTAFALWATRRSPRTDPARAGLMIWGGWLLCTGLTFSYMGGIFHQYYTVALSPAVAALVGMGADTAWRERGRLAGSATLAVVTAVTAWWSFVLLGRSADFLPWLRYAVLLGGAVAAVAFLALSRLGRRAAAVAGLVGVVSAVAGPAAYSLDTVSTAHTGSIVTAGPAVSGGMGGPGGRGGFPGRRGGFGGPGGVGGRGGFPGGRTGQGQPPGQSGQGLPGGAPGGFANGQQGFPGRGFGGTLPQRTGEGGVPGRAGGAGGMGGLLGGGAVNDALVALLEQDGSRYTWPAATIGSQNAAGYQLASGQPVMAVGGFNGTDPAPTLASFEELVRQGRIHWFLPGGGMGGNGTSGRITGWVEATFATRSVGGTTVYDLTHAKG